VITLQKVKFKNFMSYGNTWTEFNLDEVSSLLTGPSGNGKSVITEAIFFSLFGSPYRKGNKSKLVNRTNKKKMECKLYLNKDGIEYKIHRGMKPDKLDFYDLTNDPETPKDKNINIKEFQQHMELLLGVDKKLFSQIVMIDVEYFKPFLSLPLSEKRHIIDKVFGIDTLQELSVNLKEVDNQNNVKLNKIKTDVELVEEKIKINEELEKKNNQEQLDKLNENINNNNNEIVEYNKKLENNKLELNTIQETVNKEHEELNNINTIILDIKEQKTNLIQEQYIENDKVKEKFKNEDTEIKNNINTENNKINTNNEQQIIDIKKITDKKNTEYNNLTNINKDINLKNDSSLQVIKDKNINLDTKIQEVTFNVKAFKKEYDLAKSGQCPNCNQPIHNAEQKIKDITDNVTILKEQINVLTQKKNTNITEINKLEEENKTSNLNFNKKIQDLEDKLILDENNIKENYKLLNKTINNVINDYKQQIIKLDKKIENEIDLISTQYKDKEDILLKQINKNISIKDNIQEKYDEHLLIKNNLNTDIVVINTNIVNKKTEINKYNVEINTIKNKKKNNIVITLKEELNILQKDLTNKNEMLDLLAIMKNILGDNGIRKHILQLYLPLLNQYINEYIQLMEMDCSFKLNEKFEVVFDSNKSNNIDYDFASVGETIRLNLALMLAFIRIAEKRCGNRISNLIVDEAFSSLDEVSAGLVLEIITKYLNKKILCISHNPDIKDFFRKIYTVSKDKFSTIEEE
jgi:DNA repair exonuclease SbcCD ATPase subunit